MRLLGSQWHLQAATAALDCVLWTYYLRKIYSLLQSSSTSEHIIIDVLILFLQPSEPTGGALGC